MSQFWPTPLFLWADALCSIILTNELASRPDQDRLCDDIFGPEVGEAVVGESGVVAERDQVGLPAAILLVEEECAHALRHSLAGAWARVGHAEMVNWFYIFGSCQSWYIKCKWHIPAKEGKGGDEEEKGTHLLECPFQNDLGIALLLASKQLPLRGSGSSYSYLFFKVVTITLISAETTFKNCFCRGIVFVLSPSLSLLSLSFSLLSQQQMSFIYQTFAIFVCWHCWQCFHKSQKN